MANNTDWLNISQMTGGTGETALSLTALTNTSLEPKTATITARNTQYNVSDTTTVTIQGFVPTLTLSRSTLRFDSTGGTATFTVYSNTAWTINFPALVHSYSTSAGTGDTEVTVVLAPNPDEVAKIDTGIVKDVYNVNQLFLTIVQESFITELYVEPDDDIIFANTGSSTSVTITSNTDWELEYPSWVVPSITTGASGTTTVTFTAGENGPTDRSGQIIVYAGSKSVTINAFQPFYIPPYITVTPSAWTFNYMEDGKVFVVDSYPAWSGEIISTGETVWTSDTYIDVTYNIPSAMTMSVIQGYRGDVSYVFCNAVRQYSNNISFPAAGTYKVRFEISEGGVAPVINKTYAVSVEEVGDFTEPCYAVAEYEHNDPRTYIVCTDSYNPPVSAYTEDGQRITLSAWSYGGFDSHNYYAADLDTGRSIVTFVFEYPFVLEDGKAFSHLNTSSYLVKLDTGTAITGIEGGSFQGSGALSSLTMGNVETLTYDFSNGNANISEIVCRMQEAPVPSQCIAQNAVASAGTLSYPAGSDYSGLLSALNCYGRSWTGRQI